MNPSQLLMTNYRFKIKEQEPLSGGITARNLKIIDTGMGQLELQGDFTITIKVLNLCSSPTPKIQALINTARSYISSALRGVVRRDNTYFGQYNAKKNDFNLKATARFTTLFNFKFQVNMYLVRSIMDIRGNDFAVAIVDDIRSTFTDKFGGTHIMGGFSNLSAPVILSYKAWEKNWSLVAHEFFHTLGLKDLEDAKDQDDIMYHVGKNGLSIAPSEKLDMITYIMDDLRKMTHKTYQIPNLNTVLQLRQRLNNPSNEVSYNRNNFR